MTDLSITATLAASDPVADTGDRPPLVPAEPGGPCRGTKRQWSPAELALLDAYYPDLGPTGIAPYLPARTVCAITEYARKRGLHFQAGHTFRPTTQEIDRAIKRLYHRGYLKPGELKKFCQTWDRPRQWVRLQAIRLGVRFEGRRTPWKPEEDAILNAHEGRGTRYVQKALTAAGYPGRTEPAIGQRMWLLGLERRDKSEEFTASEVGRLLGLDSHVVLNWIKAGSLKAQRGDTRGDGRASEWIVSRASLRSFLIRHPGEWFPGRCDRFWLVDILAGKVG